METWQLLIIGFIASIAIMCITWVICVKIGNAGWVDVVWAYSIGAISLIYFLLQGSYDATSLVPLILILAWSFRLGTHLAIRIATEEEDGRYQDIKRRWGGPKSPKLFGFFMIQAAASYVFSLPVLFALKGSDGLWSVNEWVAVTIAVIAIGGESIAGSQLSRFKKNPDNKGLVCKEGLWRYSRHPNYFFEWLYWLSFPPIALATGTFYLLLIFPAVMLFLVLRVTGIPPTEAQAVRKRGDLYREYQNETSAFFPWFPKKKKA